VLWRRETCARNLTTTLNLSCGTKRDANADPNGFIGQHEEHYTKDQTNPNRQPLRATRFIIFHDD
jgi:hypothetical protein